MLNIVMGNSKLGSQIPNINLPPIMTCKKGVPCSRLCYARRGNFLYQNVQQSAYHNLEEYWDDPEGYFDQIIDFCNNSLTIYKFFRFHSSGDVADEQYLEGMVRTANACPQTRFLAFTKKYEMWNTWLGKHPEGLPENLIIVYSNWDKTYYVPNPYNLPMTYVDFCKKELNPVMPDNVFHCPGKCYECQHCWMMKKGDSTVFHQH